MTEPHICPRAAERPCLGIQGHRTVGQKMGGATTRLVAWTRILDALAEQRDALEYRIWRESPDDTQLAADCQTWCGLSRGLTDLLRARRTA